MEAVASEHLQLQVGLRTDAGRERPVNEDSLGGPEPQPAELLARKGRLYVVADGMGGHVAGSLASDTAVRAILEAYYRDPSLDIGESLVAAVEQANATIYAQAQDPDYKGMGSTLVAAVVHGSELHVANVGDSRAYLLRGQSITQLTEDHSWVQEQRRAGVLTEEEARNHPYSHIITRSLGALPQVQVDLFQDSLQPGDAVLLCSDGLWGMVGAEQIWQTVTSRQAQQAADELVALANQSGGSDNITAVVIRVGAVPVAPRPTQPSRRWNPLMLGVLLIVVGVISLTIWLLANGPASRRPPSKATPTKTAAVTATRPAPTSAAAQDTTAPIPTPKLTSTLFPKPTTVITSSVGGFRVGEKVEVCADCSLLVNLRKGPVGGYIGDAIDGLEAGTELIIWGPSERAMLCNEWLGVRWGCTWHTWWPVRTTGDSPQEGWVTGKYLESIAPEPGQPGQ